MADIELQALSGALPIYAEEGFYREVVPQNELVAIVAGGSSKEKAHGALSVLKCMFEGLGLLDVTELARGNWAFVSFPAYLVGRSLLETLATPHLTVFHPGYWQQGGHKPDSVVEEQRQLLAELEGRRIRFHPASNPLPIRFVFVAWGLIRLGDDFLLVHREDRSRPDAKNYTFPGGRFNIDDLPAEERNPEILRRLHNADIEWVAGALNRTLSRELDEELTLRAATDYLAAPLAILKPYRRIEGAKNNHAYTEYHIQLFNVSLTPEGETRLLDYVASSLNFEWFRLDGLLSPMGRADGKTAFIDALRNEYQDKLPEVLSGIPDSSSSPYKFTNETGAVDIPATHSDPFRVGKTGKEKELLIPLTQPELALLSTLVAHARGFDVVSAAEHVCLLGGGWIKLLSREAIAATEALVEKLADAHLPLVQMAAGMFARVAIDPAIAYFGEAAYRYQLDGYRLHINLTLPLAPWATPVDVSKSVDLDPTLKLVIRTILADGSLWKGDKIVEGKDIDREFRDKIDKHLRPLGLRKLIRTIREDYVISVPAETA